MKNLGIDMLIKTFTLWGIRLCRRDMIEASGATFPESKELL